MTDWKQFEKETTENLIEYIKWKEQPDYIDAAKNAFVVFCFRFRADIVKKCEVICSRWKHDISVADELANRVFNNFWNNPNYQDEKRRNAKTFEEGVLFYLYGIANREIINLYRQKLDPSPYLGDEEIIWDFPEIDMESMSTEKRKELIEKREVIEIALERLTSKHKIVYLTYLYHGKKGKNLPAHLRKQLQDELGLAQATIRYYKFEAEKTIQDYLKIWELKK